VVKEAVLLPAKYQTVSTKRSEEGTSESLKLIRQVACKHHDAGYDTALAMLRRPAVE